jgi:hypothetical protein
MPTDTPNRFRAMADSIERNEGVAFGGAFVIIPPDGGGEPIETLILDSKQDLAQFWNAVITKCQIMLADVEQKQRAGQTFGRR